MGLAASINWISQRISSGNTDESEQLRERETILWFHAEKEVMRMLTDNRIGLWNRTRMESRIRRKVSVRFGEGDTPYPQGSTVPTLRKDFAKAPHSYCTHRV